MIAIDGPAGAGKTTIATSARRATRTRVPRHRRDVPCGHRGGDEPRPRSGGQRGGRGPGARGDPRGGRPRRARRRDRRDGRDPPSRRHECGRRGGRRTAGSAPSSAARQRQWAEARGGGVIEGRDIGSVVFPDAVLKLYLTASPRVRAERRVAEAGGDVDEIEAAIAVRDGSDSIAGRRPVARGRGLRRRRHHGPRDRRSPRSGSRPCSSRCGRRHRQMTQGRLVPRRQRSAARVRCTR